MKQPGLVETPADQTYFYHFQTNLTWSMSLCSLLRPHTLAIYSHLNDEIHQIYAQITHAMINRVLATSLELYWFAAYAKCPMFEFYTLVQKITSSEWDIMQHHGGFFINMHKIWISTHHRISPIFTNYVWCLVGAIWLHHIWHDHIISRLHLFNCEIVIVTCILHFIKLSLGNL